MAAEAVVGTFCERIPPFNPLVMLFFHIESRDNILQVVNVFSS